MFSERALASQTVIVGQIGRDSAGAPVTDAVLNYTLYRQNGDQLDFSDNTFGGTITTPTQALTQLGTTGIYRHALDLSNITNHATAKDSFYAIVAQTGGTALLTLARIEIVVNPDDMIAVAYDGAVHLHPDGSTGTEYGIHGTMKNRVTTAAAAKTLADLLNYTRFELHGEASMTLPISLDFTDMEVIGRGGENVFDPNSQSVNGSRFSGLFLQGTFADGDTDLWAEDCALDGVVNLPSGKYRRLILSNETTLKGGGDFILREVNALPGSFQTKIDVAAVTTGADVLIAGLEGDLEIEGFDASFSNFEISMAGGHVTFDNSNTAGTIVLSGTGTYDDNGTATVDATNLTDPRIAVALGLGNYTLDNIVYDSNGFMGSARIRIFDSSANTPSSGGGSETTGLLKTITVGTSTADSTYPTQPGFVRGTV